MSIAKNKNKIRNKIMPGAEPLFVEGNDTGILLLHGFTGSPYEMRETAQLLQEKNYTISLPLLSGHGTNVKDLLNCKWTDWFEDAKQALFKIRNSCKNVFVIGLSTGASLALHLAAHYQVEGVIALSPALFLKGKSIRLLPIVPPFIRYRNEGSGPDISDLKAKQEAVAYHKTPIKAAKEILKLYDHLKMDLPEIYTPVLIVQSVQDHVVDFKGARWIYDHIASKEKQFLKLEKSFHVVTLDIEKNIVNREIDTFILKQLQFSV